MELNVVTKDEMENLCKMIIEAVSRIIREENSTGSIKKLYNNTEACKYLKVCSKTLQNYRDNGLIRYIKKGRKIFYLQEDLNHFLESHKIHTFLNFKK